ncbi:hypothetical protein ZWY2020_018364 [Hordeum vulgare]|nr:hypothetical protein ZWY2020_018364 [Hordeum vulgare]
MQPPSTTLLRRVAPTPAATNAAADTVAASVGHPTLAAPVSPPASPTMCCPAEFPPGFTPPRSGPRSQADPDLGPLESQPRGSPASGSTIVLESPPVPAAPSAPCVGSRPARRVRFNVPDLPAAGIGSKGACRPSGTEDTCVDVPWVLDWTLLPPPPPLSTRAATKAVEVSASASASGSFGHALTPLPGHHQRCPHSRQGVQCARCHPPSCRVLADPLVDPLYNGCKWKGEKLKLEKAKEHYLVRLKREWSEEAAAAAQEMPTKDDVDKQEEKEKRKLEKDALETSKVNIYFPRLRELKPMPFKGSGKHKYSFRNIEIPSYPIHFCDCEEHCGPPEKANEEYAVVLNRVAFQKERNIMNYVMSKLFEKDTEQINSSEVQKGDAETDPSDAEETDDPSEEELDDDLVINIAPRKVNNSVVQLNRANQAVNKMQNNH